MRTLDIIKYINNRRNKQFIKNQYDENCISNTCHGVNYFDVSEVVGKKLYDGMESIANSWWKLNKETNKFAFDLMEHTGITKKTLRNWIIKYENVYLKRKERRVSVGETLFFT